MDSLGYEVGLRGFWHERLFVGDAGTTEASSQSERKGVEVTAYYRLTNEWTLDLEYAYTDAKFTDSAPEGDHIPGSVGCRRAQCAGQQ